jgi:predicted short-subunit dehydrogenase-like oxidoreductase (DUF2520 family)
MIESNIRIGFIGAGVVGATLARALQRAGYTVTAVASRSFSSAQRLADAVPGCRAYADAQSVADASDVVFITTGDQAIVEVGGSLRWRPGQTVAHTSGVATSEELSAAKQAGAYVASFHPLQTFAEPEQALANLPGTTFAIEGELLAVERLKLIAESLGGHWIVLRAEDKALYHVAAVMVSNYTVALVSAATDLWRTFGVRQDVALEALLPLLKGTVDNIETQGLPDALTGPVARGDIATVQAHLDALEERSPTLVSVYRQLALQTIPVARAKGSLTTAAADALYRALEEARLVTASKRDDVI